MNIDKAIEQLRELREDRVSFINGKDDDFAEPFKQDIEAIDIVLSELDKYRKKEQEMETKLNDAKIHIAQLKSELGYTMTKEEMDMIK